MNKIASITKLKYNKTPTKMENIIFISANDNK
ncbi:hypothetical protein M568_18535 [Salmonella enterica subsp. enterica serovar Namur str. 05-2929]|nr:hypothetical protein CFSAN001921_20665 [Salmonella enterica subsp. enterica serovar Typhimurium var. 5- str. CFSAN001921]AGQ87641.1 hypothetical protein SE451236_01135 [Salmonella enterica subsp. enterica serovar 4,[5],12:i:- str. 08-1736]AHB47124.1 hypothetical protein Q786_19380 [Salmonella enterica subsp. enterica serovar Agona str. 24249]EQM36147.1 hypothetical protein B571_25800 [Salmonella enterica subsp. enterica serovar Typhimurium str. STm1]EQM51991.1 hypothetical protein B576_25470